ncbi:hypothetical protein ACWD04_30555 [Streptomyces sp. NPDC002911]
MVVAMYPAVQQCSSPFNVPAGLCSRCPLWLGGVGRLLLSPTKLLPWCWGFLTSEAVPELGSLAVAHPCDDGHSYGRKTVSVFRPPDVAMAQVIIAMP